MTHVFRYSVPVEITVRVDIDDPEKAELAADALAREALNRVDFGDGGPVTITGPVDFGPAYETEEVA